MDEKDRKRDLLEKFESLTKILAAIGVFVGSVWIPYIIGRTSEQSDRAKVYMQVMSEREKADTAIRQEMFKTLLANYLGRFEERKNAPEDEESFRKRIMFLDLLNLNFQEYLEATGSQDHPALRISGTSLRRRLPRCVPMPPNAEPTGAPTRAPEVRRC